MFREKIKHTEYVAFEVNRTKISNHNTRTHQHRHNHLIIEIDESIEQATIHTHILKKTVPFFTRTKANDVFTLLPAIFLCT